MICPGSIIDLDDSTIPLGFIPIQLPQVTLQCGESGRRGTTSNTKCVIRGGGKRSPDRDGWNTDKFNSYKDGGHAILGGGNVAQIYVYGENAYEVTFKGLTMDNSVSRGEMEMYGAFVQEFGAGALRDDDEYGSGTIANSASSSFIGTNERKQIGQERTISPSISSGTKKGQNQSRNLQIYDSFDTFDTSTAETGENVDVMDKPEPAHRYASIAVRGNGYGDDPGPRIITIDDCEFIGHRGYAVLVSPGIELPEMPIAPKTDMPEQPGSGTPHNFGNTGDNMNQDGNRKLSLLDGDAKFISQQGSIKYFDNSAGTNYLDGRRVKIINSDFTSNNAIGDQVAGVVTSAYSLTMSKCKFSNNSAKSMVYVYNNEALIDNTIFTQNTVQAATVVLKTPEGSKPLSATESPNHLVERSCFIGSNVGMSNVLVTDIVNAGFGQRDNHATGSIFSWDSDCEGAAAEKNGEDCLESGVCDGTCVAFTSGRCMSEIHDESNQQDFGGFFMWNASVKRQTWGWNLVILLVGIASLSCM